MSIHVRSIHKQFGSFVAVNDVSFSTERGQITALLGPSGSGKSTVLRIIAGLESPDRGEVSIDGEDSTWRSAASRGVGFVFQHYALFRHLTVAENVGFGLTVRKIPPGEIAARVAELLELVQLSGYGRRYPTQLSGGQRQRVALARALAPRPRVLLLDEPFGALDAHVRGELRAWLRRLHEDLKMTTLIVTHDQEEAMELSDKIIVMNRGALEQSGTPDELFDVPATPFVASFIGGSNRLQGRVRGGVTEVEGHLVPLERHLPPRDKHLAPEAGSPRDETSFEAFVRPQDLELRGAGHEGGGHDATGISAKVERLIRLGWQVKLEIRLASGRLLTVQRSKEESERLGLRAGDLVRLHLREARIFPFTDSSRVQGTPLLGDLLT